MGLLITTFLKGADARAADWKFYGRSDLPKSEPVIVFYDAGSIAHLSDSNVSVQTKTVGLSEVERIMKVEAVSGKAQRKIESKYVPPYILSDPQPRPSSEDAMKIIVWEEAADYDVTREKTKTRYELDCAGNMIRTLSRTALNKTGGQKARPKMDVWTPVRPGSNAEALRNILCRPR